MLGFFHAWPELVFSLDSSLKFCLIHLDNCMALVISLLGQVD